jgi:hypothetical protein
MSRVFVTVSAMKGTWMALAEEYQEFSKDIDDL